MKKIKGYIFSRPFFKERAPQHIQNIIIRDFCKNNNLHYSLSAVEFAMEESFKTLNEIINNMNNLDGIVAYSLFQLPVNDEARKKIVNKIINKNKTIYFALEDLKISNSNDFQKIENIWLIKKALPRCLKEYNI
jgi:sporadic carbohydrate cluster protein (TIGR04323 family)